MVAFMLGITSAVFPNKSGLLRKSRWCCYYSVEHWSECILPCRINIVWECFRIWHLDKLLTLVSLRLTLLSLYTRLYPIKYACTRFHSYIRFVIVMTSILGGFSGYIYHIRRIYPSGYIYHITRIILRRHCRRRIIRVDMGKINY